MGGVDFGLALHVLTTLVGVGVLYGKMTADLSALTKRFDQFEENSRSDFMHLREDVREDSKYLHGRIDSTLKGK